MSQSVLLPPLLPTLFNRLAHRRHLHQGQLEVTDANLPPCLKSLPQPVGSPRSQSREC